MGYMPKALLNYLARLGWSHGDDEIMSMEDMISWFDTADINKGAARFDFAKLNALSGHHIRGSSDAALVEFLMTERDHLSNGAILKHRPDEEVREKLTAAMPGLKERAKTLVELCESSAYLFAARPLALDEGAKGLLDADGRRIVAVLLPRFEAIEEWSAAATESVVRAFAEAEGLKLGKAAQPLRAALTGRTTSPGVFDVLAVLGREESLARLSDQAI
jgi:glutamyl-tRNA synthetase